MRRRKKTRFAVGHFALGYLLGKGSAKALKVEFNIPLVITLSIIPDMDILAERIDFLASILSHRGPAHSFLVALIFFVPLFVAFRKTAVPYFLALIQHALIADYFTGGQLQLFWPLTTAQFGILADIQSTPNIVVEFALFVAFMFVLILSRDVLALFRRRFSNLILAVPIFTVLLPTFAKYPLSVPSLLIMPHVTCMVLFSAVLAAELLGHTLPRSSHT